MFTTNITKFCVMYHFVIPQQYAIAFVLNIKLKLWPCNGSLAITGFALLQSHKVFKLHPQVTTSRNLILLAVNLFIRLFCTNTTSTQFTVSLILLSKFLLTEIVEDCFLSCCNKT